jgi:hypothetical protein
MEAHIVEQKTGIKKRDKTKPEWDEPKTCELKGLIGEPVLTRLLRIFI